jgi:hypothetical protein
MEPGIKGVSEIRRMPRLGKIRLGIKEISKRTENPYPVATDYFVVPDEIKKYVGDKPTKLNIMFPVEDPGEFAIQWLRCYSFTQGLVCKGNGMMCRRKVDTLTGAMADHTTAEWEWQDGLPCDPETCPEYSDEKPQCRRVMNLLFLMPDVPGFGVWQLDTSSFYSIVNINSSLELIKRLCGRISFIPLTLSLEPQLVEPPGIKRKTVHILQIRSDVKLAEIQRLGRKKPEQVLLPPLDEEEIPTDLFPEELLAEAEGAGGAPPSKPGVGGEDVPGGTPTEDQRENKGTTVAKKGREEEKGTAVPTGKGKTPEPAGAPPAANAQGAGFSFDMDWLNESLKTLRWSEVATKTFLARYKVDTKGTIPEVLSRLTRQQAEDFTNQITMRLNTQPRLV